MLFDLDACLVLKTASDKTFHKPGTLLFASPEVLRSDKPHSPIESDAFAVGKTFAEQACDVAERCREQRIDRYGRCSTLGYGDGLSGEVPTLAA